MCIYVHIYSIYTYTYVCVFVCMHAVYGKAEISI